MENKRIFKIGAIGAVIAALCCFTPLLVVLLTTIGLSSLLGMLDIVLLPVLGIFIAITLYAYFKTKKKQSSSR